MAVAAMLIPKGVSKRQEAGEIHVVLLDRQQLNSGLTVHLTSSYSSTQTNLPQNINRGKPLSSKAVHILLVLSMPSGAGML